MLVWRGEGPPLCENSFYDEKEKHRMSTGTLSWGGNIVTFSPSLLCVFKGSMVSEHVTFIMFFFFIIQKDYFQKVEWRASFEEQRWIQALVMLRCWLTLEWLKSKVIWRKRSGQDGKPMAASKGYRFCRGQGLNVSSTFLLHWHSLLEKVRMWLSSI